MNLKKLLLFLAAPLMLVLTGCESTPIVPTYADCQVVDAEGNAITSVNFSAEQGSQKILVKATRSWTISNTAEWFAVNPVSYNNRDNSEQTTEVTIDVFANDGEARSQAISIACGDLKPVEITVAQAGQGQTALGEVLYYDNFDKKDAAKGSDGYFPYMSADYGNPTPESQSGVTYTSHNVTARNNSNSNGSYSDCASEASGANNIFFGKAPNYLTISGISLAALEGNALTLKFATEKYSQDNGSKFTESEFRVYISADGAKWSEIDYTFAGTAEGRWNIATAQFNLKEVPSTVSLYFTASVASSYRLDDVKLIAGGGGAEIDLAAGTAIDGSGNTGGDNTGGDNGGTSGGTVDATIPEGAVVWNIGAANQTWAAETHATLGAGFSATVDNLKVGCYKYNSTTAIITAKDDHFRVYKNSAFVIEPLDGRTITKVVMLCTDPANYDGSVTHYTFDLSVSDGSTAVSDQTAKAISWTGNTAKFEAYAVNGQVRIKTLAVVLDGEGSGTVTPDPEPTPDPSATTITIPELYTLADGAVSQNYTLNVVVSGASQNSSYGTVYVMTKGATTAGNGFTLYNSSLDGKYNVGDELKVTLTSGKAKKSVYNGVAQISDIADTDIEVVSTGNAVNNIVIPATELINYLGMPVTIENATIANGGTWGSASAHTSHTFNAGGTEFTAYINKRATNFHGVTFNAGTGNLSGIAVTYKGNLQIAPRDAADVQAFAGSTTPEPETPTEPTPDPEPEPETPAAGEWAGRDDFSTITPSYSYGVANSTKGWAGANCQVIQGGSEDKNAVQGSLLGTDGSVRAIVINGKTSAVGTITSPVIAGGCGKLALKYGSPYSESKNPKFKIEIMQNGAAVKTIEVTGEGYTKNTAYNWSQDVNVAGDFQIVITNLSPSANTGNKDRTAIWDIMWTAQN